jgi:thiamine-monophosphate kinase
MCENANTPKMITLEDVGETRLVQWLLEKFPCVTNEVVVCNGHDAAVLKLSGKHTFKSDTLVVRQSLPGVGYYDIGWKAAMACASDLAAVGSYPIYATVSFSGPRTMLFEEFKELFTGLGDAFGRLSTQLVGGDLSESANTSVSVSLLGGLEGEAMLRGGSRAGDVVAVSKPFGLEPLGLKLLTNRLSVNERLAEKAVAKFRRPVAEVELGCALGALGYIHSCTDSSDGLLISLNQLLSPELDITINRLPVHPDLKGLSEKDVLELVLSGGEEYALVFSYDPARDKELVKSLRVINRRRIVIGEVSKGHGRIFLVQKEKKSELEVQGWRQFQSP